MARTARTQDFTLLQMALIGYQAEKEKIEGKIRELRAQLKGRKVPASGSEPSKAPVKRVLSDEARNRIAAAQKKRWAEHRRQKAGDKSGE